MMPTHLPDKMVDNDKMQLKLRAVIFSSPGIKYLSQRIPGQDN